MADFLANFDGTGLLSAHTTDSGHTNTGATTFGLSGGAVYNTSAAVVDPEFGGLSLPTGDRDLIMRFNNESSLNNQCGFTFCSTGSEQGYLLQMYGGTSGIVALYRRGGSSDALLATFSSVETVAVNTSSLFYKVEIRDADLKVYTSPTVDGTYTLRGTYADTEHRGSQLRIRGQVAGASGTGNHVEYASLASYTAPIPDPPPWPDGTYDVSWSANGGADTASSTLYVGDIFQSSVPSFELLTAAITSVNSDNPIVMGTAFDIAVTGIIDASTVQTVTLGGVALTVNTWSDTNINATLAEFAALEPITHTLVVTDDNGSINATDIALQVPSGWSSTLADGTGSTSPTSLAKKLFDDTALTVTSSDYYAVDSGTVNAAGEPSVTSLNARVWDDSAGAWTAPYVYALSTPCNMTATTLLRSAMTKAGTTYYGGDAPSGSLPAPTLFADSFESGSMAAPTASVDTANFAWGSHAWSYLVDVNTDQILWRSSGASTEVITPNDWEAKTGNRCLRFNYIGGADTSEQRFSFDAQDELWLRYWIRVPTNYTHPSGSDVHKFLAMWNTTYQAGVDGGATAWMSLFNNGSGGSNASITHMNGNTGSDLAYEQSTPFISVPADRGRWMQLVVRLKTESSVGAADGIIQTWRRWDGDTDFTALHSKTDAALNEQTGGWQGGYFMGWVNDTYAADTEWLIDDVELSDQSLLGSVV